jgi:RHS repeat-associated protein
MGYTGHELDAEVGIVNAKGRLFDPKLGRFLQVDLLQTDLLNAQRWNSYSYGLNNPLRYTDPSGFDGDDGPVADRPNVSIGPRWDAHGQLDPRIWSSGIARRMGTPHVWG